MKYDRVILKELEDGDFEVAYYLLFMPFLDVLVDVMFLHFL